MRNVAFESLECRHLLAALPVVSVAADSQSMIGETVDISVVFDNQASGPPTVGYGRYVDLYVDVTGAEGVSPGAAEPTDFDGFSGISASFQGASLTMIPVTLSVLRDGDVGVDYNFGEFPICAVLTGDSNHDRVFNSSDLILVFQAGEYEDAIDDNSTFAEGDWNGDGDFNSSDLVLAIQRGNYVNAAHDSIFAELGERRMSRDDCHSLTLLSKGLYNRRFILL